MHYGVTEEKTNILVHGNWASKDNDRYTIEVESEDSQNDN